MVKKSWIAVLCILALVLSLAGCGGEETTVSGMVISLDGTVVTVMEMSGSMESFGGDLSSMFENGEMPQRPQGGEEYTRPEGMEDFTIPEGFDFESFDPENMPEGFNPGMFGGVPGSGEGRPPMDGEKPEMPEGGSFPGFGGMGDMSNLDNATTVDIANARIGVEFDGGKESGTLDNVIPGAMVTITISPKGEVTYVLVSSSGFGFGNSFMPRT